MGKQNSTTGAAIWSFIEKFSMQGVGFVIGIILARLLSPTDYGTVGLAAIFLAICNVFIEAGFGNAIIRKNDRTEQDLSTALIFNAVVGLVMFIILWFASYLISDYFDEPLLIPLVRIAGLNLFIASLGIVQNSLLTANLQIRTQTIISLAAQIPSGVIAIVLAYYGWGVYSLALQTLIGTIIRTSLLWYFAKWRPTSGWSKNSFKYLWGYGSKLLGANLIGITFDRLYGFLIGKFIGKAELGYFSKGDNLNNQVFSVFTGMVQRIALPILSKNQDNKDLLASTFREAMRLLVMTNAIIAAYMFIEAKDIVVFLWTDKWLAAADAFRLLAIASVWAPVTNLSLNLLMAVGRTDIVLKLEVPKKIIYVILIYIGFQYGVNGLCYSIIGINIVASIVNMWATKKVIAYSYTMQMLDILKYMGIALILAKLLKVVCVFESPLFNILVLFLPLFGSYFLILYIMKDEVAVKYLNRVVNWLRARFKH